MIISISKIRERELHDDEDIEFPGYSTGHVTHKWCFPKIIHVDGVEDFYLGSWEFHPMIPIFSNILALLGFPLACYLAFSPFGTEGFWAAFIDFFFMVSFIVSYTRSSLDGPGYFPFYWAYNDQPVLTRADFDEYSPLKNDIDVPPEGFISRNEQLLWARTQPRPPRSMVSKSSRRIVIRPDHYCNWSQSWIGKRNQKFFNLFTLYGFLFTGEIAFYLLRLIWYQISKNGWTWNWIFLARITGFCVSGYFAAFCISFSLVSWFSVFTGITIWEKTNKIPKELVAHSTICENVEDAFGPRGEWYCYCIACYSPWSNKTNEELVSGYRSYYENR